MGINTFKIGAERQAVELTCDSPSHRDNAPRAWFDSGSLSGNAWLADTVGWKEYRCKGASAWLCPRCSDARKARTLSRPDGDPASSVAAALAALRCYRLQTTGPTSYVLLVRPRTGPPGQNGGPFFATKPDFRRARPCARHARATTHSPTQPTHQRHTGDSAIAYPRATGQSQTPNFPALDALGR